VGTGLGLWIVKGMLTKVGGWIRCRSRVGTPGVSDSGTAMMVFLVSEEEAAATAAAA
jgi:signal transduction histidine kinase